MKEIRRRMDGEDQCDDSDELKRVKAMSEKLRKFLLNDSNRILKSASEIILNVEECVIRLVAKNERLEGRLQEREWKIRL